MSDQLRRFHAQSHFWGSFFDLNGTQFRNSNIEFQLDRSATFNGAKASFTVATSPATPGQPVIFSALGSSSPHTPLSYDWDFGDGSTATGQLATHAYASAGTYTARLQVTDAVGDASESPQTVRVCSLLILC